MRAILTLTIIMLSGTVAMLFGQEKPRQKPYILEVSGACHPGELSIEYYITGQFGGYASFVRPDPRFFRYEIPAAQDGFPARSMKVIVRAARCRTAIIEVPQIEQGGRVIKARLRRARGLDFRGRVVSNELLSEKDVRVTVIYWANWKCEVFNVPDCLIGPNRVDEIEVKSDGRFKLRLPDIENDAALSRFSSRGTFEFVVRDRNSGSIRYHLRQSATSSRSLAVAPGYPDELEFTAEPVNRSIPNGRELF